MTTPHEYAQMNAERFRQELHQWLQIPSVSTDQNYAGRVREAAEWLLENMRSIGLTVELIEMEGHPPMVYGEWLRAGAEAKTVLVYGHYDVQPASKSDGWDTEPFEPVEQDGLIFARGASDDKGQTFTHIKAVEALLKTNGLLPVNIKFLIEGEEESGSFGIREYIGEHGEKLTADVCVISDTSMGQIEQPVIVNALRGNTRFEVLVRGPKQDLHSGMYGGTVHNPLQALAEIISKLHNSDGSVAVPGFYDDVRELTDDDKDQIAQMPWDNVDWAEETGALLPWGEDKFTLRERTGARPTLEITGMAGGYYGEGMKNIIPAKAWAKISCRIVPDQKPDDIAAKLRHYIEKLAPPTVQVDVTFKGGAPASLVDSDTPAMQAAIRAYEKGWGAAPIFKREGGSIPIVGNFQNGLNIPVVLMGFGKDTNNVHGPNEHFSVEMFHKGVDTSIHFLREFANL